MFVTELNQQGSEGASEVHADAQRSNRGELHGDEEASHDLERSVLRDEKWEVLCFASPTTKKEESRERGCEEVVVFTG